MPHRSRLTTVFLSDPAHTLPHATDWKDTAPR